MFLTTFTFWFHLFRYADKIYEDEPVVHLELPPHHCNVTARMILNLGHLHILICRSPPPILRSYWLAQRQTTPVLPSYWLAQRQTTAQYAVTCLSVGGRGGAWYNITTCRMAEGSKDPCISHIDASHGEWPRIESSLLFCIFFILSKS